MSGITIKIDDKAVRDALARLSGLDLAKMLRGAGEVLTNSTRERLAAGVDVQGKPFAPLSPLTQQLKKKNKTKPLIREGDLFRELRYQWVNGGRAHGGIMFRRIGFGLKILLNMSARFVSIMMCCILAMVMCLPRLVSRRNQALTPASVFASIF